MMEEEGEGEEEDTMMEGEGEGIRRLVRNGWGLIPLD